MTRRVAGLNAILDREYIQVSPVDAQRHNLDSGDQVIVTSRRGSVKATVEVTTVVPEGLAFMDFHFPESPTNVLTSSAYDPIAKIAGLKVCAVRLGKVVA